MVNKLKSKIMDELKGKLVMKIVDRMGLGLGLKLELGLLE